MPLHGWGSRFSPFLFLLLSFAIFGVSSFQPRTFQAAKSGIMDVFAPMIETVNRPFQDAAAYINMMTGMAEIQSENHRLMAENRKLREWYHVAMTLRAENETLQSMLNIRLDPDHRFIAARVMADTSNPFMKTALVRAGKADGVTGGQAVISADGLVGRIIESGRNTARILMITDVNSRIPVLILGANQRAVMAGQNDDLPVLMHLPPELQIEEGARIITSGHGGLFPYGLPVGEIVARDDGGFAVRPYAGLDSLHMVRIIDQADDPNLRLHSN